MVSGSAATSSSVSSSGGGGHQSGVFGTVSDLLTLNRLEFLRKVLAGQDLHHSTVADLLSAHRPSTCRQYEAGWRKFQRFVSLSSVTVVTPQLLLRFASSLFHGVSKSSLATVSNAMAAIKDPVKFGFGVVADTRQMELLRASFFIQRPRFFEEGARFASVAKVRGVAFWGGPIAASGLPGGHGDGA